MPAASTFGPSLLRDFSCSEREFRDKSTRTRPPYSSEVCLPTGSAMSFPSQRDVDALTSFEDDEFDALLSGAGSKLAPSKSPALPSASAAKSSPAEKASSSRVRSSTVAVSAPSKSSPAAAKAAPVSDAAPAPLTFGSTAFLSELQNRRKHVLHDNSLKAGASDDDADPPPKAADKESRVVGGAAAPKSTSSHLQAATSSQPLAAHSPAAPQQAQAAAETASDTAAPDASACLRRLDRLPSTVEKCLKE